MSDLIPEGWEVGLLPQFVWINPKLNQEVILSDNLNVSFIKMEDVSNNAIVKKKRTRNYSEVAKGFTKFNNHDVLVAKITPCFENGKGGYVDDLVNGIGFGSTEFHVMRAKKNLDSRYLYQYTNFPLFRLQAEASMCGTGGQRRVQTDFLRTYKLTVPPLPEQQKIAAIFTSVDEVIEKTQAQCDKLKDLKTAMMQTLLLPTENKGVGNDGKPHTEFKDSPVGRIPKGWEVKPLDQVVERIIDCEHKTAPYVDKSKYMVVRTSNVRNGELVFDDMKYTHSDGYIEWTKRAIPSSGDIMFTREAPAGESCLVPQDLSVCLGQRMVLLRPNLKVINANFFSLYLTSAVAIKSIYELSIGTTVSRINIEDIKKIPCVLPSLHEQLKIANSIQSIQNLLNIKVKKLKSLHKNKKALMQDLLTGKVRVTVPTPSSAKAS